MDKSNLDENSRRQLEAIEFRKQIKDLQDELGRHKISVNDDFRVLNESIHGRVNTIIDARLVELHADKADRKKKKPWWKW